MLQLHRSLVSDGIKVTYDHFREVEAVINERARKIRREELREIGNDVWLAEALKELGFSVTEDCSEVTRAIDAYFTPYLGGITLFPETRRVLDVLVGHYKLGLVSNFTFADIVRRVLKKLDIERYFNPVVISHDVNWRKPHAFLFRQLLDGFGFASSEVAFVGDDLVGDVAGAQKCGLLAIHVDRGPVKRYDPAMGTKAAVVGIEPDFRLGSLDELPGLLQMLNEKR